MTIYTTIQGDTWDMIAWKVYHREICMSDLLAANPDIIATTVFSQGVNIKCPDIEAPTTDILPPWRR
jgi:phage tail protein X